MLEPGLPTDIIGDELFGDHYGVGLVFFAHLDYGLVHSVVDEVDCGGGHERRLLLLVAFHKHEEDLEEGVVAVVRDFLAYAGED
jgi:hypothetical protein